MKPPSNQNNLSLAARGLLTLLTPGRWVTADRIPSDHSSTLNAAAELEAAGLIDQATFCDGSPVQLRMKGGAAT